MKIKLLLFFLLLSSSHIYSVKIKKTQPKHTKILMKFKSQEDLFNFGSVLSELQFLENFPEIKSVRNINRYSEIVLKDILNRSEIFAVLKFFKDVGIKFDAIYQQN